MTSSQPLTLLLDVDGTLIDSLPGVSAAFLHALDAVGWDHPDDEFIARIPGPPMEHTLARLGMDDETRARAFEAYMDYTRDKGWADAHAFEGWSELLPRWKDRGLRLVTATSKGEQFARAILDREGLLGYIDFLGAAQEDGPRRTKADVIAYVLDNVDIPTGTALMIGDRLHDLEGAAQFGIPTALVKWGYGTEEEWAQADYVAASVPELDAIVNGFITTHTP
ncbi:HAD hydrolase-like protein [Corynebacterium aquatimens]